MNFLDGELFLTAQNFFSYSGIVPYALGVQKTYEYDAAVYPFPSFKENNNPPYGLYSAAFTALDKCGNLWILDQGSRSWSDLKPVFSPGLFRYNLAQKRMTLRYRFPSEFFLSEKGTAPTTLIVDNSFSCDKLKLIVADPITQCLLIFDLESESSWQIQHPTMSHDPEHSTFTSDNYTLSIPSGVYSTAITPPLGKSKTKFLIYSSYAGITTYAVPLSIVYNKNLWTQGYSIWRESKVKNKSQKVKKWFHQKVLEDDYSFINVDNYFQKIGSDPTHLGQYCDIDWERKAQFCAVPSEGAIDYWKLDEPFKNRRPIVKNKSEFLNGAILQIIKNRYGKNEIVLSTSPITVSFF
ncbi:Y-e3.2 family protein [Megaselia abdita]